MRLAPDYRDLPAGTTVRYTYDPPSGNCLIQWNSWTDTVGAKDLYPYPPLMTVKVGNPWESCAWERSYGSWNVTVTIPSGESHTVSFRAITGAPNIYDHVVDVTCNPVEGLPCSGGSDSKPPKIAVPTPPLQLGPFSATPPPSDPQLACTGTLHLKAGQRYDGGVEGHFCTIEGYPRATVTYEGLPAGLSASRWPNTVTDNWLAITGTPIAGTGRVVTVTASLPSGWKESRRVGFEIT